jgi:hypothetical protein
MERINTSIVKLNAKQKQYVAQRGRQLDSQGRKQRNEFMEQIRDVCGEARDPVSLFELLNPDGSRAVTSNPEVLVVDD